MVTVEGWRITDSWRNPIIGGSRNQPRRFLSLEGMSCEDLEV